LPGFQGDFKNIGAEMKKGGGGLTGKASALDHNWPE